MWLCYWSLLVQRSYFLSNNSGTSIRYWHSKSTCSMNTLKSAVEVWLLVWIFFFLILFKVYSFTKAEKCAALKERK